MYDDDNVGSKQHLFMVIQNDVISLTMQCLMSDKKKPNLSIYNLVSVVENDKLGQIYIICSEIHASPNFSNLLWTTCYTYVQNLRSR